MAHLGSFDQKLRDAIEQAKREAQEHPETPQAERIRELSRQHYERTGAPGDRGR